MPTSYPGFVRVTESWKSLRHESFSPRQNAIVLPRSLEGLSAQFSTLAGRMHDMTSGRDPVPTTVALKRCHIRDPDTRDASRILLKDIRMMNRWGLYADLRVIGPETNADHLYDFHEDFTKTPEFGRLMYCYSGSQTDIGDRSDMLTSYKRSIHDGISTAEVDAYTIRPGAEIFRFPLGDIWRQACKEDTGSLTSIPYKDIPAVIHRAPRTTQADGIRLLIVADIPRTRIEGIFNIVKSWIPG